MTYEIRNPEFAEKWLAAGAFLSRLGNNFNLIQSYATTELAMPPSGVLADISKIIENAGGTLNFTKSEILDKNIEQNIRLYEDNFLALLAQDPRIESASNAIARLPNKMKNDAIALLITRILKKTEFSNSAFLSPSIVRRFASSSQEEIIKKGLDALHDTEVSSFILSAYKDLAYKARRTGTLLAETDIFILENLELLPNLSQRMAVEQIVEVASEFDKFLPRKAKPKSKRKGPTPTKIDNEDNYPIGGFSSIATNGTLENLVTSELIYMDENPKGVDLFDMRYVEGELLYYKRDESVFVRQRHNITFVFMPELEQARFKDQEMKWQRSVIALGLLQICVQKLSSWLTEEGLNFRVCFIPDKTKSLEREKNLTKILLREWVDKGILEIFDNLSTNDVVELVNADAIISSTDMITFGMNRFIENEIDNRVQKLNISLSKKNTKMTFGRDEIVDSSPWDSWQKIGETLLNGVV